MRLYCRDICLGGGEETASHGGYMSGEMGVKKSICIANRLGKLASTSKWNIVCMLQDEVHEVK